jgi:hemerythrin
MSLEWREQLSVGNEVIDSDHKRLIGLINSVELALNEKSWDALSGALEQLSQYGQDHFAREEKIAQAAGYAKCIRLRQEHVFLIKDLARAKSELEGMQGEWSETTIKHFTNLLRRWLIDHVIKEDMLLKPVLQAHPYDFNPD